LLEKTDKKKLCFSNLLKSTEARRELTLEYTNLLILFDTFFVAHVRNHFVKLVGNFPFSKEEESDASSLPLN
jgi:hypothetical protein